ncbi:hypothetical protein ScPMuIL_016849 [Solemya velum]
MAIVGVAFIVSVLVCLTYSHLHDLSKMDIQGYTDVRVSVVSGKPHSRVKRFAGLLDDELLVRFEVAREPRVMRLWKNKKMVDSTPIYVMRNGAIVQEHIEPSEIQRAYYQNIQCGASFVVEILDDGGVHFHALEGIFFDEDVMYVMQPVDRSGNNSTRGNSHVVATPKSYPKMSSDPDLSSESPDIHSNRDRRAADGDYKVELFIVTDYAIYNMWYQRSTASTPEAKDVDAKRSIRNFFQAVLNGIDTRFGNIASLNVDVVAVGFFISESTSSTSFLNDNNKQVNAGFALTEFETWLKDTNGVPPNDHAMVFTAYKLVATSFETSLGLAYVDEVCTSKSLSIVEDRFDAISITVATHELGHSLGLKHDGDDNTCNSAAGYIMSVSNTAQLEERALNPWRFSSCSVAAMTNKLSSLGSAPGNCLLQTSAEEIVIDSNVVLPGVLYTVDQQCRYIQEYSSSYVCRLTYNTDYSTVCKGLWCKKPSTSQCQLSLPAEHTPCGNQKWCVSGNCVSAGGSPSVPETCPYGNRPGIIHDGLTCSEIFNSQRRLCYEEDIQKTCCSSCIPYGPAGCEFGDRSSQCSDLSPVQCYTTTNANLCCETCKGYEDPDNPNCLYGDQAPNCVAAQCDVYAEVTKLLCCKTCQSQVTQCSDLTPIDCYTSANVDRCSAMCRQYEDTGNQDCLYGDKAPNCVASQCDGYNDATKLQCCKTCPLTQCSDLTPIDCYNSANVDRCSATCKQYEDTGNHDCLYGDKAPNCVASQCDGYTDATKLQCCKTCPSTLCSDLTPIDCYTSANVDKCSETCKQYEDTGNPDCRYGDKAPNCVASQCDGYNDATKLQCCKTCPSNQCSDLTPIDCYTSTNVDKCSETCKQYEDTGKPDCLYGDKAPNCVTSQCDGYNDATKLQCCKTCPLTQCSDLTPIDCYNSVNVDKCSATCRQYQDTGNQDCLYGDKTANCVASQCDGYADITKLQCCKTCLPTTSPPIPETTEAPVDQTATNNPTEQSGLTDVEIGMIAVGCGVVLLGLVAGYFMCDKHHPPQLNDKPTSKPKRHSSHRKQRRSFKENAIRRTKSLESRPKRMSQKARRRRSSADKYRKMKSGSLPDPFIIPRLQDSPRRDRLGSSSPRRGHLYDNMFPRH